MSLSTQLAQLLDSHSKEEEIHAFLSNRPSILRQWAGLSPDAQVRSKVSLVSRSTDFALGEFRRTTNRWYWTLVELERPDHKLFTKAGDPTKELSHAIRQIVDWKAWIQNNTAFARTILPDVVPTCSAAVIIGRRAQILEADRDRLAMLEIQTPGLIITTYDALLDACE